MGRQRKPQPNKHWSNKALPDAIEERRTLGTPVRVLEQKYNVPKSTIDRHFKNKDGNRYANFIFILGLFAPTL